MLVTNAKYVIVNDPSHPGGERLLIDHRDENLNHSDLSGGEAVKYAGTITTGADGRVHMVDATTGHYKLPDVNVGRFFIETNQHLSLEEKEEQLAALETRGPAFRKLIEDKFGSFLDNTKSRPLTPELTLKMVDDD
jgi:hypothetical protein